MELQFPVGFVTQSEHVLQLGERASHFVIVLGAPFASPSFSACRLDRTGEDANRPCIQDTDFKRAVVELLGFISRNEHFVR